MGVRISPGLALATNGNYVLGGVKFQEEVARVLGRRVSRGKGGRPKKIKDRV